jgi:hypothetical protein
MNMALVTLLLLLAAAFFTSKPLRPRARAAVFAGYLLLYAFILPILLWLPLYFSADFSREAGYPGGFKEYIYSSRASEKQRLPVNNDLLIAEEDYRPGASDKRRVVILGDSFAAGFGLDFKDTLGARLQELLGNGCQVINGAFFGTNAEMQVEFFFSRLAKYRPAVIVIRHRMDDVMPFAEKYYLGESTDIMAKHAPLWTRGVKNFFLKREALLIREKFWEQYRADTGGTIKRNMLEHYDRLGRYAAENRVRVVLVLDRCPEGYEEICAAARTETSKQKWELLGIRQHAPTASSRSLYAAGWREAASFAGTPVIADFFPQLRRANISSTIKPVERADAPARGGFHYDISL